jgi:DNA-binding winged helix-turn-helix (wHTH) protein
MALVFGGCTFDRERRELTRDGAPVHAGPKLLRFLELLIDARPRALTKGEIHDTLWPATFVSDGTLTSLAAELREAIGDDARHPRLIRTIHGYGYVFCGEVAAAPQAPPGRGTACCRVLIGDREVGLDAGSHLLGRSPDVKIFVDDVGVSRHHARITVDARGALLEDLGSKNGTILNGSRVDGAAALEDGATIVLGATALRFRMFADTGSTETVTSARGPA